MTASHSQLRNSESQGPKNRQTNCNFFRQKMGSVETKHIAGGSLRGTENDAGRNGYPLLLVRDYLTRPRICAGPERSLVAVGLLAASSAAFCLRRRSLRGLNFCRFGVLVGCAHDARAAEQGQRCGNESKFLHCFRFTSFRFERIFERQFTA